MSLDDTRHIPRWVPPLTCLILILPVALVVLVSVGVGVHYHPDKTGVYLGVLLAAAAVALVLIVLVIVRWRSGTLVGGGKYLAWLIGGALSALGAYTVSVDIGDWLLWIWFLLLGLSVLWMARP